MPNDILTRELKVRRDEPVIDVLALLEEVRAEKRRFGSECTVGDVEQLLRRPD